MSMRTNGLWAVVRTRRRKNVPPWRTASQISGYV